MFCNSEHHNQEKQSSIYNLLKTRTSKQLFSITNFFNHQLYSTITKIQILEKAGTTSILTALLQGEAILHELRKKAKTNIATASTRLVELREAGLITDKIENGNRHLSLTEKGQKVAEKLQEIEKIMEE